MEDKEVLIVDKKLAAIIKKIYSDEEIKINGNEAIFIADEKLIHLIKNVNEKIGKENFLKLLKDVKYEEIKITQEHYF